MSLSSPSTRRKLLLDSDEAPEDDQPNAWTCSYVMSSGDGVNLLGTLDVDRNRARFVANSGLFGTAYQFVMPRDQIQIVRVPTASSPYNALELHTKYRQNILCDFDDNVATFKRCCEVMKLDVLPQDEPLIAVLPTDVSDHANKWRARAAQKRREREAAEALAARGGGEPDDGHQLTQQVMHLHGEKVALQRRMFELERENEHLHGEVEVLYAQVDEQSERSQRQREALEAAAREALDDVLAADMEKERTRREAAREKEKLLRASQREEWEKENKAVTPPDSALKKAEQEARAEVSEAEKLINAQRQDELVASVASLREERAMFEGEVARLRLELERRDAEREEKLANADADADADAENAENKASSSLDAEERDDDMQDMLAMEVQRLLAKQAELSNHLARAQREKEMLEKENELLYQQTEAVEEDAQTARFERALAWERLSEAESAAGFRVLETAIAPSSPPRDQDVVSPSVSSRASPIKAGGPPIKGSALPKMEKASDGPDAELAAKLIGRLERGGESDEAASLKLEMERMKAELGRMKAERAESLGRSRVGYDAASETKPSEEDERRRSGEDTGDSASAAAAAALRAALEKKEEELRIERRRVAKEIAAATKRAAAEASAREKEEALWRVTEAELRAADAERALEALRVEKEESERALALATEELRSERSRSRAGSVSASLSQAGDRTRDSQNDGSRVSLPFGVPLPDPPGFGTDDRTSSDGGWSVPERVWQEILLEKESALSALSASDKAKEDEIERLRERLSKLERRAKKEASTHEGSTPSPPKRSVSRSVKSSPATAFNETFAGVGKLPAIDVSGKSVTRLDSPTAKATSPEYAKSPRSPFAKGLTGLGVAAAGFVFGKLSPQ